MRNSTFRRSLMAGSAAAVALAVFAAPTVVAAQAATYSFNIPAQDLSTALRAFGRAARQQVVFDSQDTGGKRSSALVGTFTADAGLQQLLGGTGLTVRRGTTGVLVVAGPQTAADLAEDRPSQEVFEQAAVLPEVLVQGGTSLNTDVRRSEDDVLPYVVFDRFEIQQSQAANVEDFLRTRLPMATDRGTASRNDPEGNTSGNRSSINLRGLGANQTLILVNGRRAPGVRTYPGDPLAQPDLNGIPIASIERIEVLPGTASGIYGGGATGGVINIILRKDYSGAELQLTYDNSFDTDSARRRIDLSTGFSLEGGRTQVMLSGSYSDGNDLLTQDRDFVDPARQRAFQNAPDLFAQNARLSSNRVNFASVFGSELTLQDGTPFGSTFGSVPVGYLGGDGGAGLLAGAGTLDLTLPEGVTGQRQSLSAVPESQALNLTIRREMTEAIDAYLDLSATRSRSVTRRGWQGSRVLLVPGQAGNPFQEYVYAALPDPEVDTGTVTESGTQRINGGVIVDLSHGWTAGLDANWNRSTNFFDQDNTFIDPDLVAAAVAAGEIDPFRDLSQSPIDFSPYVRSSPTGLQTAAAYTKDYTVRIAGPLFRLPAGQVRMTGLVSQRRDEAPGYIAKFSSGPDEYYHPRNQVANSLYVETVIPLFSEAQNVFLVRSLEAQFSARWDRYLTTTSPPVAVSPDGSRPGPQEVTNTLESTDYTIGLKYTPFADVSLRVSYATGFLPPSLSQLIGFEFDDVMYLEDPLRGNTRSFTPATFVYGGNPDVRPEQSTSESFGVIYTPSFIEGLRISVDFVRINKTDELTFISETEFLQNEALFPGRVVRGANLPGDPAGWAGVVTYLDQSLINIARSRVEATDIQVDYERDIGDLGWFRVYAVGTVQSTMERQATSSSPTIDRVGFADGPGELRFNVGVDWQRGPWSVALNTQFYDEYRVYASTADPFSQAGSTLLQGSSSIPSQTYTDISGRYVFDRGWLTGTQVSVGVRNVFNQKPPMVATQDLSGGYSTFGDPRLRTYSVSIRRPF